MRILIAEDDKGVANFLKRGLKEEQYSVDVCFDGEEALNLAEIQDYDLIILDVMLPKKNGFEVCKELRTENIISPIIMLTAKDQLNDKIRGLNEGADDYLTKPFKFQELLARIRALMRRNQDFKSNILKVGDLELDLATRQVRRESIIINLTGKEFALLEYLMRNKGKIVTQTMIIEHIWDMNYDGLSNIVNVYINHLRERIDKNYNKKYIHTIRSIGFKIDDTDI